MTLRSYTDSLPTVTRPPGTGRIIPHSLIEALAALAIDATVLTRERHLRRRDEIMEETLRVLYEFLASGEAMVQSHAMVQRARDLTRAALVLANTCWHCGWLGTRDDPVIDRSYEGHMLNARGQNVSSGRLIPDQSCRDHRRCIERQEARNV